MGENFLYQLFLTELSPTDLPACSAEPAMGTTEGTQAVPGRENTVTSLTKR